MSAVAGILLLAALASCQQPQPAPVPRQQRVVPAPTSEVQHQHERAITKMKKELRRMRDSLEERSP
jgi:TolA-binding protein